MLNIYYEIFNICKVYLIIAYFDLLNHFNH